MLCMHIRYNILEPTLSMNGSFSMRRSTRSSPTEYIISFAMNIAEAASRDTAPTVNVLLLPVDDMVFGERERECVCEWSLG